MGATKDQSLVINSDGNTLVCALPGSGKTYVLIALTEKLLASDKDYSIHLLTFTDAGRVELTERLHKTLSTRDLSRVIVSTFHSTALSMTKKKLNRRLLMNNELTLFDQSVLNEADHLDLVCRDSIKVHALQRLFDEMGRKQNHEEDYSHTDIALYELYKTMMYNQGKTDFNIICQLAVSWLAQNEIEPVRATHILVDEFQDTDELQYMWLREHALKGKKLVVVGDDDQAIYSFRGGQGYSNMVAFQQEFDADAYVLRDCFRCSKEVLKKAGKLITYNNPNRIDKPMNAVREDVGTVTIVKAGSPDNQLDLIYNAISQSPHTWAVIARNNIMLDAVEGIIQGHNIPYNRKGGKSFFDGVAPYSLIQLSAVITGRYDEQTLQRALSSIALPTVEITRLIQSCRQANCTFGNLKASDIGNNRDAIKLHALAEGWQDIPAGQEERKKIYMEKVVKILQFHLDKRDMKHAEAIGKVIGARNWESLGESIKKLAASLDGRKKRNDGDTEPKLTLITMHSSKGLQFDNVWITCAEDGGIPSKEALTEGKEEEERRLLYVAMTRAIYNLHMSYAVKPSVFLYEIDEERVHDLESNENDTN